MQKSSIKTRIRDSWTILSLNWIIFAIKQPFRYMSRTKCSIFGQFFQYFVLFSPPYYINNRYFAIGN